MKREEERLQEEIESGKADGTLDSRAYQIVFEALGKTHASELPPGFADKVVMMVEKEQRASTSILWVLASLAGILMVSLCAVAIALTGFKPDLGFLKSASSFKGILLFGVAFVLCLNAIDKFVLRKRPSL